MWASAISPRLEAALARALADSPRARELARELAGRSVELRLAGSVLGLRVQSDGERLELRAPASGADASLSGGALAWLALGGPDPAGVLRRGDLRVEGDGEVAERFRELLGLLRPDVEHALGRAIGPVPAHAAMRAARGALAWGRRAARATLRDTADYLAHERRDLVPAAEAEHVLRGSEVLREHTDRLDARLGELERRVARLRVAGGVAGGDAGGTPGGSVGGGAGRRR
ncbi:MAG: SCP2 sterol-binding domain-containing protein [Steroidobacteraceae bacterium]